MTVYNGNDKPVACDEDDAPIWERAPSHPHEDSNTPRGYLDFLTWQSRTIRLHPEIESDAIVIRWVSYSQGRVWKQIAGFYDPFVAYERVPDIGDRAVQFREDRDLWRDSAALFQFGETDQFRGPITLHTIGTLVAERHLSASYVYRLMIAGACVESGQPNVIFWRHETLPLPLAYLEKPELVELLQKLLGLAEDTAKAVNAAAWAAAANWLTANPEMKPDTDRVRGVVKSFAPDRLFWSRLEQPFRELLVALAAEGVDLNSFVTGWFRDTLYLAARNAFDRTIGRIDGGRDLKAVNAGRGLLFSRLKKIQNDNRIPYREEEVAS